MSRPTLTYQPTQALFRSHGFDPPQTLSQCELYVHLGLMPNGALAVVVAVIDCEKQPHGVFLPIHEFESLSKVVKQAIRKLAPTEKAGEKKPVAKSSSPIPISLFRGGR